jgi:hypothetical protein
MKKTIIAFFLTFLFSLNFLSQEAQFMNESSYEKNNSYKYQLGSGVEFNFDDSTHIFKIGGMAQSRFLNTSLVDSLSKSLNYFGIKRSYFNLSGSLSNGQFSFLIQTNFSESFPLLDAWIGYHPNKNLSIFFGQKMSPFNNLSMQIMEYDLQFASRNYLSQNFTELGREFGLFLEGKFSLGNIGLKPSLAVTSGDGTNSFGENSIDNDQGGFKYGGRMNIYPLGFFKTNNELVGHDILKEKNLKVLIGGASSINFGSSHKIGEGHYNENYLDDATFMFFDSIGERKLPNYLKNYIDILVKYRGLNLLFEYVNTAAYKLQGSYLNNSGSVLLEPTQISQYLVLGNAYNIQGGYLFNNDWSIDAKYGQSFYEFEESYSLLQNYDSMGAGITKYFSNKAVKTQLMANYLNFPNNSQLNRLNIECLLQVVF